ncbi:MAG: DUF308 domain-containing protein [Bradyrhizobium sp.]
MAAVLLIGGICFLVAGLVAIGFGMPVKEFSFGNTLILAGAIVACTGAIMLGLWSAVRELKNIGRQLGSTLPSETRAGSMLASDDLSETSGRQPLGNGDWLFSRDQPMSRAGNAEPPMQSPNSSDDAAQPDRGRGDVQGREPAEAARSAKPRRNLLFSSTSRSERERAQTRTSEPSATDLDTGSSASAAPGEPSEMPGASFEHTWPKLERPRRGDPTPPRRSGRSASTFAESGTGRAETESHAPSGQSDGQPPVTVLKSGVVDGMAYSLYSDGSIEAQMPEGMMRFASIDELRAHLDQRP